MLKNFLSRAVQTLDGEWLLVGGTLLPAVGIDIRSTADIDLLGLGPREASQQIELMNIAESLGLPVESVNQAAGFFLKKVGYKKADLIILERSKNATVYRPSAELYIKLKLGRFSETDFTDCEEYLKFCLRVSDPIDIGAVVAQIEQAEEKAQNSHQKSRIRKFKNMVNNLGLKGDR